MRNTLCFNNNVRICRDGRLHSFHLFGPKMELHENENRNGTTMQSFMIYLMSYRPTIGKKKIQNRKKKPEPNGE